MTPEQHAELNLFCAEHVMRFDLNSESFKLFKSSGGLYFPEPGKSGEWFKPTTSPADAMAVQKACAIKCGFDSFSGTTGLVIIPPEQKGEPWTVTHNGDNAPVATGETLEIALCLFSKSLFEKEAAK